MILVDVIAIAILVSIILYALLGGADYGGGMWDLLASGPRKRQQRDAIAHAIGPVWEANHVWLILVIVLLFTAFPASFAVTMTALHIPLTVVLIGIVLRGTAFVFRKYDVQKNDVHERWSTVFGISSVLTPFFLGISIGALGSGDIRWENGVVTSGFFAGWTSWFALGCGLFTQGLFAFLAATYMTVETVYDRALQDDFRRRAALSLLLLLPAALLVFILARFDAAIFYDRLVEWWSPLLAIGSLVAGIISYAGLRRRRYKIARGSAVVLVTLILVGWAIAQYPYIVIPDVHIFVVASPAVTLKFTVGALAVGALLLFPSLAYLFVVFKRDEAMRANRDVE